MQKTAVFGDCAMVDEAIPRSVNQLAAGDEKGRRPCFATTSKARRAVLTSAPRS